MDPRNFLTESGIFQFESLAYQKDVQNQSGVENVLKITPMYKASYEYTDDAGKASTITYSRTFMDAATLSGVSPYHLASRVKQEVVTGPTSMSSSVSGTVKGYEGIYNFYNIGANNSTKAGGAVANGLSWANKDTTYMRPWTTKYKAIVGGAQYLGSNYINIGQNTLYLQKFNVTANNTYNHQYMANIEAPWSEALKTAEAYGSDKADMSLVFSIPVYSGMPSEICAIPSGETQQSTQTVGDCSQVEQRSQLRKNGKDRPVNLRGEHEQYQQRKQLNLTAGYQHCSNENSDAKSRLQDQAGSLNQNTGGQFYLNGDFSHGLECFIQRRETGTTKTAGFDDLNTFQVFLNLAGRLQFHIYLFVKQTELQFASAPDDEECNRHRAENRKGHSPVKKCQTDTGQGNGDNIRNQRRNSTA